MDDFRYSLLLSEVSEIASETALLLRECGINSGEDMEQQLELFGRESPEQILKSVFGYDSFRPLQKNIIENVLEGRDTLAVMPTGGGKSLCYQIPALILDGITVVVSPLISLMQDQVTQLESYGVPAACLNSSIEWNSYRAICGKILRREIKILYLSPEGLNTSRTKNLLSRLEVSCITVDEAHCISEWGHDFRPDYLEIALFRKQFPKAVCLALTATATKQVRTDIARALSMDNPAILVASFNRPNLFLHVERKSSPMSQILALVENHRGESGIIYCSSRKDVDSIKDLLDRSGVRALSYHAGLTSDQRSRNQQAFIKDKADVMVATVAFGMGINKPDVRYVIHHTMPKSVEQYYQEIGRAGRDGLPSEVILLYSPADISKIRWFFNDVSDRTKAEGLLQGMIRFAETTECRRRELLSYFGESDVSKETVSVPEASCCDICASSVSAAPKYILHKASTIKSFPKKTPGKPKDGKSSVLATKLREWRRNAAEELGIPPYVIFGDKTLFDIAEKKPSTTGELLDCYGIGEAKAEKFGYYILKVVRNAAEM